MPADVLLLSDMMNPWVLEHDEVLASKRLIRQEILPVLGLDVELVDGLVAENVARRANGSHVDAIGEHLLQE